MNSKIDVAQFYTLQSPIEKKSTNIFLGYQPKILKILQNGTKIGYKKHQEQDFLPIKTFNITQINVSEMDEVNQFELITTDRVYQIRTKNQQQCKKWLKAITLLKKALMPKKKKKKVNKKRERKEEYKYIQQLPKKQQNDSTLPSIGPVRPVTIQLKQQTVEKNDHQSVPPEPSPSKFSYQTRFSRMSTGIEAWKASHSQIKTKFQEQFKKLSPQYLQYHVFIGKIKTKVKQLLKTSNVSNYYILFSSKSLYPDEHISEENLTSAFLPHWADLDTFYRIIQNKQNVKFLFELINLKQVCQNPDNSITVKVQADNFDYFFQSREQQQNFKMILDIAYSNAIECKNSVARRNYDTLILLHQSNLDGFNQKIREMIQPLAPQNHQYQPGVIKKLTDNLHPLLIQILTALQQKVNFNQQTIQRTIIDFVRIVHQQIKRYLKLVWDSSYSKIKGVDVLHILKAVSSYASLVNKYVIKDKQIYQAQKQLSKIYVRTLYKNFQKIIINIVQRQKTDNYHIIQQDQQSFAQTHSITDIFKFIYDFFKLAIPCWNDKLHLHNIHKLVKRSLGVFINQIKAMVDQEQISVPQMIAIANNYVAFNQTVEEFYDQKFSELQERTRQFYDHLKNQFRQISMVIIDRLVAPLSIQLKICFNEQNFFTAKTQKAYYLIINSQIHVNMKLVHFIFKKRYYERIFTTIRQQICKMLVKQVQKHKKPQQLRTKVIQRINFYKADCKEMMELLIPQKLKIQKQLDEIILLLTTQKNEIAFLMTQANQFYKRSYKKILMLRDDYKTLNSIFQGLDIQSPTKQGLKVIHQDDDFDRKSFSKLYMQEFDRSSIEHSSNQKNQKFDSPPHGEQKLKMISQGYIQRNKFNSGKYQKIYLKLKKSVLYIYQNDKTQRCQNTIQIQDIKQIKISDEKRPNFTINFQGLHKIKNIKLKCNSIQQRMRWTYSIDSQLRRLKNDKKIKVIKMKDITCNIIIDYDQLERGKDYFSYQ